VLTYLLECDRLYCVTLSCIVLTLRITGCRGSAMYLGRPSTVLTSTRLALPSKHWWPAPSCHRQVLGEAPSCSVMMAETSRPVASLVALQSLVCRPSQPARSTTCSYILYLVRGVSSCSRSDLGSGGGQEFRMTSHNT